MHRFRWATLLVLAAIAGSVRADDNSLTLHARRHVETKAGSKDFRPHFETLQWDGTKTAIVVCDMWDKHWCPNATARVGEMAPRMNDVLVAARKKGVLIIHCPSNTLEFYKDTPQRRLAQQAPQVETKVPLQGWCHLIPEKEGKLPIDDSDGGCDCENTGSHKAWSRQHPALKIEDGDAITDSAEAFYLMKQRGIENVIVMGVHTNMCVLGRPFSIRQMVQQGQNVVLVRDLTDTMYNPEKAPYVSHFTGNDLVVQHIETYWCPSITSADFLGGSPLRFKADTRKRVAIVMAEDEYETNRTLPEFARQELGKEYAVSLIYDDPQNKNRLVGLESLANADVLLLSVRRRPLPPEQLDAFRKFAAAGKPIVGIRTASHAFATRDNQPPAGTVEWLRPDKDLFGGNYDGHLGKIDDRGPNSIITRTGPPEHPILKGVEAKFDSQGTLYKSAPLAEGAVTLLSGDFAGVLKEPRTEPIAWTWTRPDGGQSFYTSLGHAGDFSVPSFRRLLKNGLDWAAQAPAR